MSPAARRLWEPTPERVRSARITDYRAWLVRSRGTDFDSYDALWRWSTSDPGAFWHSLWDYFQIVGSGAPTPALVSPQMPGAKWFPGLALNYAEQVFRHATSTRAASASTGRDSLHAARSLRPFANISSLRRLMMSPSSA